MQLARGTATGIGEYARGLLGALAELARPELELVALESRRLDPWRFDRRVLWDQVALPLAARRARVELLHCASGTIPRFASAALVATVHDVAWMRAQAHARPYARAYFGRFALSRYRVARALFVDSKFSRDELLAVAPELAADRIIVAYPGVAEDIADVPRIADAVRPFILAVGTVEVRKNLEVVVRALAHVPELRLISVGPPTPYVERLRTIARECGVSDRLEIRGYVPRSEVLDLYARASVAVAPSHYEGFGYAAAQALCAGVPLIAADAASLPEVVAGAAPLVAPSDVDAWAEALRAIGRDPACAQTRASGVRASATQRFHWRATAEIVARTYGEVLR